jgi:uncharacterized membrane protein YeiB
MIGLVLLFFAAKAFYDLAARNDRNKWLYAILGVVSYYAGTFIGGIAIALVYEIGMDGSIDDINDTLLGILGIPFGVLLCFGFYKYLQSTWSKAASTRRGLDEVLDADFIEEKYKDG